jgi:DNA-directed RNA polymerase sigma subunit (sigma70/sigma32)
MKENIRERDRLIHNLRVNEKKNLQAIGEMFGLTRERVRQIIIKFQENIDEGLDK